MVAAVTLSQLYSKTVQELSSGSLQGLNSFLALMNSLREGRQALHPDAFQRLLEAFLGYAAKRAPCADLPELMAMSTLVRKCLLYRPPKLLGQIARHIAGAIDWTRGYEDQDALYVLFDQLYQVLWKTSTDYFSGSEYIRDNLIIPFGRHLSSTIEPASPSQRDIRRIAYLMNDVKLTPQYAPGKLYTSWWRGHEMVAGINAQVFVYLLSDPDQRSHDLLSGFRHVTVRSLKELQRREVTRAASLQTATALAEIFERDNIHTAIFEKVSSSMLAAVHHRLAPVQLFSPMSFVPLLAPGVDGFLLTDNAEADALDLGIPSSQCVAVPFSVASDFLVPDRNSADGRSIRDKLPPGKVVFGSFARVQKLSPEFALVVARVLASVPDSIFLFAGEGDIETRRKVFVDAGCPSNRVIVLPVVDVHLYGPLIDVYLETFPIAQGLAAVEIMAKRVPVVHCKSPGLRAMWEKQRDSRCIAENVDQYARIAIQLATDPELRAEYGRTALALVQPIMNIAENARELEKRVLAFASSCAAKA